MEPYRIIVAKDTPTRTIVTLSAQRILDQCEALARLSEHDAGLTRVFLSKEQKAASEQVIGWMRAAGMSARLDAIGNVVGRYEGERPGAACLMMGSHLDTVRDAGKYDGMLGVLAAIECVRTLHARGKRLPFALEIVGFADEEGTRFNATLLGSRAVAGTFKTEVLDNADRDGVSMRAALRAFGLDPAGIGAAARRREDVLAYAELHIEQGPVLEARGVDLGIVTAIVGITRVEITLAGEAAHAGTTTMALRRDAAAAGAEVMIWIRDRARALAACGDGHFVATTGFVEVLPGAANVVPRSMRLVIDARSERRAAMEQFVRDLRAEVDRIAARERVAVAGFEVASDSAPAACDAGLRDVLESSARRLGHSSIPMASGAGHDAAFLSRIAPMAMLFVPCRGGRSHCPEEWAEPAALAAGAGVLLDAVRSTDRGTARP